MATVVASLSLATDLGTGVPQERAPRACVLAVRLGELIGLDATALGPPRDLSTLTEHGAVALQGVTAPGLVLVGDRDPFIPLNETVEFYQHCPMQNWR